MIMKAAACNYEKISLLSNTADYHGYQFTEDDICVISVPSYGGRVPDVAVQRILSRETKPKPFWSACMETVPMTIPCWN